LDINERFLLRLGFGEKDLEVTGDFSRTGRVNFMLSRRLLLLNQVGFLAKSLEVYTHEEYTCESALNFYNIQVKSRIHEYELKIQNSISSTNWDIETTFPFSKFFSTQFFESSNLFDKIDQIDDFNRSRLFIKYLENVFAELRDCYAFELLRNSNERGNYLLTKQAKVIAMTSTHAAIKRRDFIDLGLEYDNVLIEESAQLLEIETFIPLLLQNNNHERNRLKRVILIGNKLK
jgi:intron-binding protein aquarius